MVIHENGEFLSQYSFITMDGILLHFMRCINLVSYILLVYYGQ